MANRITLTEVKKMFNFLKNDVKDLEKNFIYVENWIVDRTGMRDNVLESKLNEINDFVNYWEIHSKECLEKLEATTTLNAHKTVPAHKPATRRPAARKPTRK